jgi:hypothetical protein
MVSKDQMQYLYGTKTRNELAGTFGRNGRRMYSKYSWIHMYQQVKQTSENLERHGKTNRIYISSETKRSQ